jgi:hypothetical protein
MKKLLTLFLSLFATGMAIMVSSCSVSEQFSEDVTIVPIVNEDEYVTTNPILTKSEFVALTIQQKGTYKISESEAIQNLESFYPTISANSQSSISTTGITLKKSPVTGKDMYYEVVIESDKGIGFCLLSADERADRLLCYSESGSIADTVFNKSLKYCLELVDLYVEEETNKELDIEALTLSAQQKFASAAMDAVETKSLPSFDPDDPNNPWIYDRTNITTTISERLKLVNGGWHQGSPFNSLLPLIPPEYSTRAHAGCSVIAVSQIMSYHKKPFSNYITTAMWPSMINNPAGSVDLQNLIRDIFYNVITSFDAGGSTGNITKARTFLNNNGYTAGSTTGYSYDNVWNALNYGPTCIIGDRVTNTGEKIGHAWVVDGARTTTTTSTDIYIYVYNGQVFEQGGGTYIYTTKQVHYDWGWGVNNSTHPQNNAWFSNNVFQRDSNSHNYNTSNSIISHIY